MKDELISMTSYVELTLTEWTDRDMSEMTLVERLRNYKDFLKTPLELGMFVPCYKGKPIDLIPVCSDGGECVEDCDNGCLTPKEYWDNYGLYQKAKKHVIFQKGNWEYVKHEKSNGMTIEDAIIFHLTLTKSKAKELELTTH